MKKRIFATLFAFVLMFSLSGVCFAAESVFSVSFVDSNSKTYITRAEKNNEGSKAEVRILKMYDSNKKEQPTYTRVWVEATKNGNGVLAVKSLWIPVDIPDAYRSAGSSVAMYATGFVPFLDCYISGFWNVH